MYSKVTSAAVYGIDAILVKVEVHLDSALPSYTTVGLPDSTVRESRERVNAAIRNSEFLFPAKKITVNLAPAAIRKEGSAFDLPIAVGLLSATGQVNSERAAEVVLLGELALDGTLRPIIGALPIASALMKKGQTELIVPKMNANEAGMIEGLNVYPAESLREVIEFLNGETFIEPVKTEIEKIFNVSNTYLEDFSDVKGQETPKKAIEVAAAGGHNILMVGPPGSGKTMLSKRLPTILPMLDVEEAIETTKIYSVAGLLPSYQPLIAIRPFRNPHHTVSDAGLIGGGQIPRPGEVSLAHKGVLFLDEMPEFKKSVLEVLRQPLEDGKVTISRTKLSLTYPANFILVAAMNPCPCGYFSHPTKECKCTPLQIHKYRSHISGPLVDRIDIHIEVPAIKYDDLRSVAPAEPSAQIRERVISARQIQLKRFAHLKHIKVNADMGTKEINKYCRIDKDAELLLKRAIDAFGLSARGYDRILKVARTLADLEASEDLRPEFIAEAINYRSLDREKWM